MACLMWLSGCGEQQKEQSATHATGTSETPGDSKTTSPDPTTIDEPTRAKHDAHANHGHAAPHRGHHPGIERKGGLKIGDRVPDFEVKIDGRARTLADLRADRSLTKDGTLVLNFWCSFCHSCRDVEMRLNALAEKHKGTVGVVAIDASAGETTEGVAEFAKSKGLTLPIALNADAAVADLFGVQVTTTTVVIDADGVLRYCGQFSDDKHAFVEDALGAVLSGSKVVIPETNLRG